MTSTPLPLANLARAALLVAAIAGHASGDEPAAIRVVTASDFAAASAPDAPGLALPRAGTYQVWAWAPPRAGWSMKADGPTLVFRSGVAGAGDRPDWSAIGQIPYDPATPLKLRTFAADAPGAAPKPESSTTKANGTPAPPAPAVPALLAFTTDPRPDLGPVTDLVRGHLDAIDPVPDPRRTAVRTRDEGANFRPPSTRQAWLDRAGHVREQLLIALGLWPMFPKTELNPQVFGKLDRDGYTIEKVVLETLPGFTLSGNLYRPKGKAGRLPLVLCPHGHHADGRVNPDVQARCVWWAKRLGCVVFMYDMVGYNDSKPFGHEFLNDRLRRWGLSLMTLQTWNSIRALDWAVTLPDVDPARVGCTGESGGGTQTIILTAIDPRIKVSAPVVMVSHKMQGGCLCENCAGLRIGTDNVEIAALTAPRPMKLVGADDWTDETMTVEYPTLGRIYGLLGTPERLSADKFDFPHNYNRTSRNAVYAFMGKWLVGIDDPASTVEGDLKVESPEDLRTFGKDRPAPAAAKTPAQLETELVHLMGRALDKLAPTTVAAPWEAGRGLLTTALRVRVGLVEPPPADLSTADVRRADRDGTRVAHVVVTRTSAGDRVPVVRLDPKRPGGRATVVFTARGKAGLVGVDGAPIAVVTALLERGQTVIGLDPLFVGESIDAERPATARRRVAHYETYNPSLAADRAQDLATVLCWAKSRPDLREVSLVALGEAGPLALLARPALTGLARTAIDLDGFDHGDGSAPVPAGLDLPGVLGFGGLKVAAALTSPDPLWIARAPAGFAKAWPVKSYALADAAGMLRIDEAGADPAALARWIDAGE